MKRILVSATEPSADLVGAGLLQALRARTDIEVVGLGGPLMEAAGLVPLRGSVPPAAAMGVAEVVRHLGNIATNAAAVRRELPGVDLFVPIDAPDFHLPLARQARRSGVRVCGYVSPQVWAWRAGRIPQIAACMDRLLCLFAFEPALYRPHGLDARWVGHPLVDRVAALRASAPPLEARGDVLAVFPGSRGAELRRHASPFLEVAARVDPARLLVATPSAERIPSELRAAVDALPVPLRARTEIVGSAQALAQAGRALSKSGTVTLELALAGVPAVVAHRVHPLTYWLGRLLVRGVQHIALPNVLCGGAVMSEHIQYFTSDILVTDLMSVSTVPADRIAAQVGQGGASVRAALEVQELLEG